MESLMVASLPTVWLYVCVNPALTISLFIRAGIGLLSCFTSILIFFVVSCNVLMPLRLFLVVNVAAVLIDVPANLLMFGLKLARRDLIFHAHPCIAMADSSNALVLLGARAASNMPDSFLRARIIAAVTIGVMQLVVLKHINRMYENILKRAVRSRLNAVGLEENLTDTQSTIYIAAETDPSPVVL
ncbi:uncharacterized protein [Dermacentor andersoni]|uniref:uncharacterized protein n=1 Tax=Dermacentor andersoni TaxID=34620 RepID=UPI0024170ADC|nr:uncharacterized protein LOC126537430 [Dermacentor andersoni]